MKREPNEQDAANPAIASWLHLRASVARGR